MKPEHFGALNGIAVFWFWKSQRHSFSLALFCQCFIQIEKKDYVANYDSDGNLMNVSGLDSKGNSFTIKFKWLDIIEENYDFYKKLSVEDLIP